VNPGADKFSMAWKTREKVFHTVEKTAGFFPCHVKSAEKFSMAWKIA